MSDPSRQISHRRVPALPGNSSTAVWHGHRRPSSHNVANVGHRVSMAKSSLHNVASARDNTTCAASTSASQATDFIPQQPDCLSPELIKTYLVCNPQVLEEHVMEMLTLEYLEELLAKKQLFGKARSSIEINTFNKAPMLQEHYIETNVTTTQKNVIAALENCENISSGSLPLLYSLLHVIGIGVKAEGCSMYVPKYDGNELHLYFPPHNEGYGHFQLSGQVGYGTTVAAHVAMCKEAVFVADLIEDDRFPRGIGVEDHMIQSVLCLPVTLPTDDLICIMEFTRTLEKPPFTEREFQTAAANLTWVGTTLHQFQVNKTLQTQSELNDFLLEVSKVIFDDIIAMDSLVKKIMTYTKRLVNADRCALFLYNHDTDELYADLFDDGKVEDGQPVFTKMDTVRFPATKGIAGHVARTAEIINIKNAYSDQRFNREIDRQTGYTTRNILCMPIMSKGRVLGVVQMINKKSGEPFSTADEQSFKAFSVFSSLALHYSKIYSDIKLKTAQYNVTMETMNFHIGCSKEEHQRLLRKPLPDPKDVPPDLDEFLFYGPLKHESMLPQLFIQMLHDLLGPNSFNMSKLCNFVLTVRKNYRPVSYHNWKHGWNVAHSMFCMLKSAKDKGIFSRNMMKALMIGSLSHDVDHRGYNNTFFVKLNDPLAILYPTSVMEKHHFAHTVTILQLEDHDIFSDMSKEEYKEILEYMSNAILATDLALFFPNQKNISKLMMAGTFDLYNKNHLDQTIDLMMTAADLCGVVKYWPVHEKHVYNLYIEFYAQGDKEKDGGLTPLPMMDRNNKGNLPKEQVGFIQYVCIPCYQTLYEIFPATRPLVEGCRDNMFLWQRVADGKSTGLWEPLKSCAGSDEKQDNK